MIFKAIGDGMLDTAIVFGAFIVGAVLLNVIVTIVRSTKDGKGKGNE